MKRVILNGDVVSNVEAVANDATGGMIVPDDLWVGPGTIWNGSVSDPAFSPPPAPAPEPDSQFT